MAGSLLRALDLTTLITTTLEGYHARALELIREPEHLAAIRAQLARNVERSSLFDSAAFCRHLETASFTMHERAVRGEPPTGFAVPG